MKSSVLYQDIERVLLTSCISHETMYVILVILFHVIHVVNGTLSMSWYNTELFKDYATNQIDRCYIHIFSESGMYKSNQIIHILVDVESSIWIENYYFWMWPSRHFLTYFLCNHLIRGCWENYILGAGIYNSKPSCLLVTTKK